jgi:hypothetical protein
VADRPHFAYPFVRSGGKVAVVEQDTAEHTLARANMVVRCPLGFRLERPDFGWPFPEFQPIPLDLGPLEDAMERAGLEVDAYELANLADQAIREATVEVAG